MSPTNFGSNTCSVYADFTHAGNVQSGKIKEPGVKSGWLAYNHSGSASTPKPSAPCSTRRRRGNTTESEHMKGPGLSVHRAKWLPRKATAIFTLKAVWGRWPGAPRLAQSALWLGGVGGIEQGQFGYIASRGKIHFILGHVGTELHLRWR